MAARPEVKARIEELKELSAITTINTVNKRLEILSQIANHEIEAPVTAGHVIMAISEHNKMEHTYEIAPTVNVKIAFVVGKGYKDE